MSERTISHHLLRRTARKRERQLERALATGMETNPVLLDAGLKPGDKIKVESTMRGPWGWRVVTY